MHPNEIDIVTLGCSKNLVDAERLMYQLQQIGYRCVHDAPMPNGEIAVINTCGFIGDAKEESIRVILQFAERKREKKLRKIYVMGCLTERYRHELKQEIPEVDAWFGKFNYMDIIAAIAPPSDAVPPTPCTFHRTLTTPAHYAYLKISEGCNRHCSYCAIPIITGNHRSRSEEDILAEAQWLTRQGVKEINLIAQDLSSYGLDTMHSHRLAPLIDKLSDLPGVEWLRLHYAYPADFPDDILTVMVNKPNVCHYLDLALQHCTDHMLTLMRRHITSAQQDDLIRHIRETVPDICLRTTLMVGHPGETENDFEALCDWVKRMRFERMGAFAYSDEDGTYAHQHYKDDIPQEVKEDRLNRLMAIQQTLSADMMASKVGTQQRVVIDKQEGDYYIGRTQYDSPEVDCEVLIQSDENHPIQIGHFYTTTIYKAEEFDLYAHL